MGRCQNTKHMTNESIQNVVLAMSDDSPYLMGIRKLNFPGNEKLSSAERLVYPMSDPAFGWHFTTAYFRARKPLPYEVEWPSIRRALSCMRGDDRGQDRTCQQATALGHPANRTKQVLVKSLLCSELDYEAIGMRCGMSAEVIELFAHLFFDFPERKDDLSFVAQVLNPGSEVNKLQSWCSFVR